MRLTGWTSTALAFVLLVATGLPAAGQQGGSGGGGTPPSSGGTAPGGGTTSPGTPTPGRPGQTFPQPGQQQDRFPQMEMQRPIFIAGKVMMDDGNPPPEQVVIELVCQGTPRPQGYTDSKGRFSIELGRNQAMLADASVSDTSFGGVGSMPQRQGGGFGSGPFGSRGISERDLNGCDVRANLAGFRSDSIPLSGRRSMDNPEIGVIMMHRIGSVEGFTYSLTSANAPKDAKKAYEKGLDQAKKKKFTEAEANLRKSVEVYPKYAIAWYELGRVLDAEKKNDESKQAFEQAVAADDRFVNPYLQLMFISARDQKWDEVLKHSERVTKLNPFSFPQAWLFNGVANLNLNKIDAAEKSAREAVRLDPNHKFPKSSHLLAVILSEKQDYPAALEHMRGYLMMAPNASDADVVKKQISELERLTGATPAAQATPPKQ